MFAQNLYTSVPEEAKDVPCTGNLTWWCKSHSGSTGFEGMKGSCKAAKAWHCARPAEAMLEGATSVVIEARIEGSCRKVEA